MSSQSGWPSANLPACSAPGKISNARSPSPREGRSVERDDAGRFLSGNSGGGRPKGARNRLTETFLSTIAQDFERHGAGALETLRTDDPASYLKLVASLVPRGLILQHERESDYADLTISEAEEMLSRLERHKSIQRQINAIKNTP